MNETLPSTPLRKKRTRSLSMKDIGNWRKRTRSLSQKDIGNVGVKVGRGIRPRFTVQDSVVRLFINSSEEPRLVPRKRGRINVRSTNLPSIIEYVFFLILDLPWLHLIVFVSLFSVIIFGIFGSLYWIIGGGFSYQQLEEELSFWSCIFFTLQTFDNIGYGLLSPDTMSGDSVVTITSLLSNFAKIFFGGILLHKLTDPKKMKYTNKFSDVAVWNKKTLSYQEDMYKSGVECLSFRVARTCSRSTLCDSRFHLVYFKTRTETDGYERFEFQELDFEINKQLGRSRHISLPSPLLALPWTIIHPIDNSSPLFGLTLRDMENENGEIIGILEGTDEISKKSFQARWSYKASNILEDHEFIPCVKRVDGYYYVNFSRLSKTRLIDPECRPAAWMSPMRKIKRAVKKGYKGTRNSIRKISGVIMRMETPWTAPRDRRSKPVRTFGRKARSHSSPFPSNSSEEELTKSGFLGNLLRNILGDLPSLTFTTPAKYLAEPEQKSVIPSNDTTELSSNVKLADTRLEALREAKPSAAVGMRRRQPRSKSLVQISKSELRAGLDGF